MTTPAITPQLLGRVLAESILDGRQKTFVANQLEILVTKRFGIGLGSWWMDYEDFVLLHDYKLSAHQVMRRHYRSCPDGPYIKESIDTKRRRLFETRSQNREYFNRHLAAMRAFVYFYTATCERQSLALVQKQTPRVLEICGESFYRSVLRHLAWSHHDILALMHGDLEPLFEGEGKHSDGSSSV